MAYLCLIILLIKTLILIRYGIRLIGQKAAAISMLLEIGHCKSSPLIGETLEYSKKGKVTAGCSIKMIFTAVVIRLSLNREECDGGLYTLIVREALYRFGNLAPLISLFTQNTKDSG